MKKQLLILLLVSSVITSSYGQCNEYFNLNKNSKWEVTSYNAKDKVTGKQINEVKNFETQGNGWKADLHFQSFDKKDKKGLENDVEMTCTDGVISMDMSRFIPQESMQAYKDMNMEVSVDNMELPSGLKTGMELDEGSIKLTSADLPISLAINIQDRVVEKKETIATPSGSYDCFKITYTISMKTILNTQLKGAEWVAKDVGVVKTETYNKNGKKIGYSLLTDIE